MLSFPIFSLMVHQHCYCIPRDESRLLRVIKSDPSIRLDGLILRIPLHCFNVITGPLTKERDPLGSQDLQTRDRGI